jgi:hypothetical protein
MYTATTKFQQHIKAPFVVIPVLVPSLPIKTFYGGLVFGIPHESRAAGLGVKEHRIENPVLALEEGLRHLRQLTAAVAHKFDVNSRPVCTALEIPPVSEPCNWRSRPSPANRKWSYGALRNRRRYGLGFRAEAGYKGVED